MIMKTIVLSIMSVILVCNVGWSIYYDTHMSVYKHKRDSLEVITDDYISKSKLSNNLSLKILYLDSATSANNAAIYWNNRVHNLATSWLIEKNN